MSSAQRSIQVPILFFTESRDTEYHDRFGVRLFIRSFWLEAEDLLIPYIATMDEYGRVIRPYRIPDDYFPLPEDPYRRYKLKLRRLMIQLPQNVNRQYFYAEALKVNGVPYRRSIETGEVIRSLLEQIEGTGK